MGNIERDAMVGGEIRRVGWRVFYAPYELGGIKSSRFADVVVKDSFDNPIALYQIGRATNSLLPIARERAAIADIIEFSDYGNLPIHFIPYNLQGTQ